MGMDEARNEIVVYQPEVRPRQLFKEFEQFDRRQPAKSSGSSRLKLFFPRLRET